MTSSNTLKWVFSFAVAFAFMALAVYLSDNDDQRFEALHWLGIVAIAVALRFFYATLDRHSDR